MVKKRVKDPRLFSKFKRGLRARSFGNSAREFSSVSTDKSLRD
jgi:hypothetical protein